MMTYWKWGRVILSTWLERDLGKEKETQWKNSEVTKEEGTDKSFNLLLIIMLYQEIRNKTLNL